MLKYARSYRSEVYHLRVISYKAEGNENDQALEEIQHQSYEEYEKATRKVWIIENILKDRIGYYPVKVTDDFLQALSSSYQAITEETNGPKKVKSNRKNASLILKEVTFCGPFFQPNERKLPHKNDD